METIKNTQESYSNWTIPDFQKEKGEFVRVLESFLLKEPTDDSVNKFIEILDGSPMVELSNIDWENLENTDSFHNVGFGQMDKARKICEEYNMELKEENRRDFDSLLEGFLQGRTMECPVIIRDSEGKMHLVSGNTRLMIARVLGIKPKVIIGEM